MFIYVMYILPDYRIEAEVETAEVSYHVTVCFALDGTLHRMY